MSDKQQSAVDFLHCEYKRIFGNNFVNPQQVMEMADSLAKAKELFKQQIIDAVEYGNRIGYDQHRLTCILDEDEQYFNDKFKTKSNATT